MNTRDRAAVASRGDGVAVCQPLEPRVMMSAVHLADAAAPDGEPPRLARRRTALSVSGFAPTGAAVGTKVLFAGTGGTDVVDILDTATNRWSTAKLSVPRLAMAAVTVGRKVLFAGGTEFGLKSFDTIDVYDDATGRWSTAKLPRVRQGVVATAVGTKVIFAGGFDSGTSADVYDAATGEWSTANLSHRRPRVAVTVGHLALFAGGRRRDDDRPTRVVDVYDAKRDHWRTIKLPRAAFFAGAVSAGGKAIFASGSVVDADGERSVTDVANVFDASTGRWSVARLSEARIELAAAAAGDVALFAGGTTKDEAGYHVTDVVDAFDTRTGVWSTTRLSVRRGQLGAAAVGDTAYFAGGYDPDVPLQAIYGTVDLFTPDRRRPTATLLSAPPIVRPLDAHEFDVAYHDEHGIDRDTLDDDDVFVTGPNGFSACARLVSDTRGRHGSTRVARYRVVGASGAWGAADNGAYTIRLHSRQVRDNAGRPAPGDDLGTFIVRVEPLELGR